MSHVSKLRRERMPCEFAMDCWTSDGETCPAYANPADCLIYRRKMIAEGEIQCAGWEFNSFDSTGFASFWLLVEQEWAEQEKKQLYYPDCCWSDNSEPDEEPCEFGLSENCVEPSLRNSNCCFECWLYGEVDNEDRENAKALEEVEVEA